jgi:transcriptional regulator with XRE-family HTH domain
MPPLPYRKLRGAIAEQDDPAYDIARKSGMSRWALSRIANGQAQPTKAQRARLSEVLGIPESVLFAQPGGSQSEDVVLTRSRRPAGEDDGRTKGRRAIDAH